MLAKWKKLEKLSLEDGEVVLNSKWKKEIPYLKIEANFFLCFTFSQDILNPF